MCYLNYSLSVTQIPHWSSPRDNPDGMGCTKENRPVSFRPTLTLPSDDESPKYGRLHCRFVLSYYRRWPLWALGAEEWRVGRFPLQIVSQALNLSGG